MPRQIALLIENYRADYMDSTLPSSNSLLLVSALESISELEGRYIQLKCVNVAATGAQRGNFSLVFQAFDKVDQRLVALKFFDIDPSKIFDQYRTSAFQREHTILQSLVGVHRCLQVASAFSIYKLPVTNPNGSTFEMPCPYFAVEWLDEDVDLYFQQQDTIDAVEKLRLFHEVVLAVEALHSKNVYHRDLKMDNFRAKYERLVRLIVAIDLGTAARLDSPPLLANYGGAVGLSGYAPAEALCGFSGERKIAHFTDIYALGCMLFELFNRSYFYRELLSLNPNYQAVLTVMSLTAKSGRTPADSLEAWHTALRTHAQGVTPVSILAGGHTVPASVSILLGELVMTMTRFDYRQRLASLEFVRRRIQSALACLKNERVSRQRIEASKARRAARITRIAVKEQRLVAAMANRVQNAK